MKKLFILIIACSLVFMGGCGGAKKYTAEIYGSFDTITKITAYCKSDEEFSKLKKKCEAALMEYSKIFDIYVEYAGVDGLFQINANAGAATKADARVIELLQFGKECYLETEGRVNIAMGSVLKIWHDWRENGGDLPSSESLRGAADHADINKIIIDEQAQTVMLADSQMRLDVGAIAKGFAVEKIAQQLKAEGAEGFLISAGGNVRAVGAPIGKKSWSVGIENPQKQGELIATEEITNGAVVTSGGYARFLEIGGKKYHHIIDPETMQPAVHMKSATIIYSDSGIADSSSTAVFLMEPSEIAEYIAQYSGMRAIIVDNNGETIKY